MNTRAVFASRITLKRSLLAAAVTIGVSWGVVAFIDRYQEITVVPERSFASTEYALGDSELATPVTVDLASLASKLNAAFPESFRRDWKDSARFEVSTGLPRIRRSGLKFRKRGRVKVKIDVPYQGDARLTRGAIELIGHGNDLEVRMPVSFWVRLSGRGSLGRQVHETAEGRFVLSARVNASLTEAWGADIQLTHTLEWQGAPGGKLFNAFPYTIRGLVEDGVNREAAKLVAQINMELNQGLELKERALAA